MHEQCSPIFIIGSARTGTSALVHALKNGADIAGYNEGHYLTMMHALIKTAVDHVVMQKNKNKSGLVMMSHITADHVVQDIMEMMKKRMEATFSGKIVWLDKTPDGPMLRLIPYLILMWPNARFIYTKRRAMENVVSRLKKFKHLDFKQNCERWVMSMDLWQKMKHHIPENQRIEIDQYDMSLKPGFVAERLGTFLGLGKKEVRGIAETLGGTRVEFTGGDEEHPKGLHELGWTSEQIDIYNALCKDLNRAYGYSEDSSYYLSA